VRATGLNVSATFAEDRKMPEFSTQTRPMPSAWTQAIADHRKPVLRRSVWQLTNSLIPYLALWGLMIWTLDISYGITLALAVVAAGFLVRIFIIFHDCGHGSFFRSRRANRLTEFITGALTFTPYGQWRHEHALHHATSGNLDRRGTGEIWTLTVREYVEASRWKRVAYRLARNPFVLFGIAPFYVFLVQHRFPSRAVGKRERRGVYWTNAALLGVATVMSLTIGIEAYVLIQLPVIMFAGAAGVWLFYVQHQFEGVQWDRRAEWNYLEAALRGSSYYKLPKVLQWFTGNIGFHHIHHLSPTIPNYNLARCHRDTPMFQQVKPVTLWCSLKSLSFRLWDEQRRRLVGFGRLRALRREICSPRAGR
jgi:omega-6 fatty acid desaturase (delta-12 desaturase)